MKRFAGMVAVLLVSAAQSQMPGPDQTAALGVAVSPDATATSAPQATAAALDATVPQQATAATLAPQGTAPPETGVSVTVPPADVDQATAYLKSAANDFTNCRRPSVCEAYFDSFGIAISLADGSIHPYSHVQRLSATSRECIKKAKALEQEGDRILAVQWAMAARVENRTVRDWLGNHPDAVLAALRKVTVL